VEERKRELKAKEELKQQLLNKNNANITMAQLIDK
jgi:hypothetical protein